MSKFGHVPTSYRMIACSGVRVAAPFLVNPESSIGRFLPNASAIFEVIIRLLLAQKQPYNRKELESRH